MKWKRQYEGSFLVIRTPSSVTAEIQKSAKTRARVAHVDELKEYVGKPPKSWLAAAQDELDEVSLLGEAGASAERTTRSTLDGGDDSEAPEEVDRTKSPEVGKSSVGRVPAGAKSSSDNVSDGACGDDSEAPGEAARAKSPVRKSSVGRVPAGAKSSSDNVSDSACGDDSEAPGEVDRAKSPEEAEEKSSFGR